MRSPIFCRVHRLALTVVTLLQLSLASVALAEGDRLLINEYLFPRQQIAATCFYRLVMQLDGNLVMYDSTNLPIWASNTVGTGAWAVMQPDGNFVIYNADGAAVWATNTFSSLGARLQLQADRNLVVYDPANNPLWASNTYLGEGGSCHRSSSKTSLWQGWNLPGTPYRTLNMRGANQAQGCAFACSGDSQCIAFSYSESTHVCGLMSSYSGSWTQAAGIWAGFVTRESQ